MQKTKNQVIHENLPYEKYLRFGGEALTESELLAIILRTGTKDKSALDIAEEILNISEMPRTGLLGLYDIPLERLLKVKGLGMVKAVKIKCIAELAMRINCASAKDGMIVNRPETVANYFMEKLRHKRKECVILACLDAKCQILKEIPLSSGSVNMSLISPREVFLEAIRAEAVNIILIHNHPSGDPSPSNTDMECTKWIKEMGDKLDVALLDHIIIGDNCYTSFKEKGYI